MSEIEGELIRAPDVLGEVIGWRAWTVIAPHSPHPRLRSANAASTVGLENAIWPTNRWMTALCPHRGHEPADVPTEGCSCGLYAANSLDHLLGYGYAMFQPDGVTMIGQVGFAGKVIPGSQGWKGQRGRIVRLYVPLSQHELGAKLARAYNVPFELATWWATDKRLHGR